MQDGIFKVDKQQSVYRKEKSTKNDSRLLLDALAQGFTALLPGPKLRPSVAQASHGNELSLKHLTSVRLNYGTA